MGLIFLADKVNSNHKFYVPEIFHFETGGHGRLKFPHGGDTVGRINQVVNIYKHNGSDTTDRSNIAASVNGAVAKPFAC